MIADRFLKEEKRVPGEGRVDERRVGMFEWRQLSRRVRPLITKYRNTNDATLAAPFSGETKDETTTQAASIIRKEKTQAAARPLG